MVFTVIENPVVDQEMIDAFDSEVKNTLETSGEDFELHSKRVEKISNYTRNEWRRFQTTLETSGEDRLAIR